MGRPTFDYDETIALDICTAIATQPHGLEKICKQQPHWPSPDTLYKWIFTNEKFAVDYARAKELQQEVLVNHMMEVCTNRSNDEIVDSDGKARSNMAAIQRDRLIADNIKWTASRLLRKYSDRSTVDSHVTVVHEATLKDLS